MLKIYQFFIGNHKAVSWAEIRALRFFRGVNLSQDVQNVGNSHNLGLSNNASLFDKQFLDYKLQQSVLVLSKLQSKKVLQAFSTMGGSLKIAKVLRILRQKDLVIQDNLNKLQKLLAGVVYDFQGNTLDSQILGRHNKMQESNDRKKLQNLPKSQKTFGVRVNFYGFNRNLHSKAVDILKILKKDFKQNGFRVKFLGNLHDMYVNTASSERIINKGDLELNVSYDSSNGLLVISQTIGVQNYDLFSRLEFDRPERDMQIGMMPIKLAFIMLNLAQLQSNDGFWDPMCGVGTLIMAGLLKGLYSYGSDINHVAVAKARANIEWLIQAGLVNNRKYNVFKFDVRKDPRNHKILGDIIRFGRFNAVVTEGYLGIPRKKPFVSIKQVQTELRTIENLYKMFLRNVSRTIFPGSRVVFTVPLYKVRVKGNAVIGSKGSKLKHVRNVQWKWIMPNVSINKHRYSIVKYMTGDLEWINKKSVVARKIMVLEKVK